MMMVFTRLVLIATVRARDHRPVEPLEPIRFIVTVIAVVVIATTVIAVFVEMPVIHNARQSVTSGRNGRAKRWRRQCR